jgi:non-homologous end joining protein Ku
MKAGASWPFHASRNTNGILGMTLRYAHKVRSELDCFQDIPNMTLPRETVQLAEHILETKTEDLTRRIWKTLSDCTCRKTT